MKNIIKPLKPIRALLAVLSVAFMDVFISLPHNPPAQDVTLTNAILPDDNFFSSAYIADSSSFQADSDGDLWPSCWSDDGNLYAANGDGKGFNLTARSFSDVVINRISGSLPNLNGMVTARGDAVGQVWTTGGHYNRKPTGMVCVDGAIYVAIQDLSLNYDDAPSASISMSVDHGKTWTWDKNAPMFTNYQFTTIMFLDYGQNSDNAIDNYVYAYGLDNNWRDSVTHVVPNPVDLYLARVPKTSIMDRSAWQFFGGLDKSGQPTWASDIDKKVSALHDDERLYSNLVSGGLSGLSAFGQGGIVYDKPLRRYIYSSWTESTFAFYEAPNPWGPWTQFLSRDFGPYPWSLIQYGGYATTIPSKFISADGKTLWVQSNVCPCGNAGMAIYAFSLRKLEVEPRNDTMLNGPGGSAAPDSIRYEALNAQ